MKRLPIRIKGFKELIEEEYYYVDKTMFIKNILEEKVVLYARPRRFGRTLNMSALYYFFFIKQKEDTYLFNNLNIIKRCDAIEHLSKYPVLMISLRK